MLHVPLVLSRGRRSDDIDVIQAVRLVSHDQALVAVPALRCIEYQTGTLHLELDFTGIDIVGTSQILVFAVEGIVKLHQDFVRLPVLIEKFLGNRTVWSDVLYMLPSFRNLDAERAHLLVVVIEQRDF